MAVRPPLETRILQSRESDPDAEMSSSSASEEEALEYNMSEDLENSPEVISPPPASKPEKANKYKNRYVLVQDKPRKVSVVVDDPRRSSELYQVHAHAHPKEIQSQQRIRNKILFRKPQTRKNMITCGLFCSTFWADLKTLRIIRESQTSDMPTKEASKSCLVASVAVN
ncbi:hypothetical protein AVEN_203777-1 [Araneus ventricosus]|uniref:Uncharacterized protein n=1 Tax=Araneus ventricosus TaxID=182803 RepID=A0A4Y2IQ75_ARAVE|nr:hypothetical protein AVEN_203777-1 [Araneus ventricosus]